MKAALLLTQVLFMARGALDTTATVKPARQRSTLMCGLQICAASVIDQKSLQRWK